MTDHKEIWLQPWCAECAKHLSEGREWCENDQWGECGHCHAKATRYVLAEPHKLKISYLVAGEEGVVARGFKSEEDAKLYADALNAGIFKMTQQQQANEIYEAARLVGKSILTDPLEIIAKLNKRGFAIVRRGSNKEAKP